MQYTYYMIDIIVWTNIAKYKLNALFVNYGHIVCMMNFRISCEKEDYII